MKTTNHHSTPKNIDSRRLPHRSWMLLYGVGVVFLGSCSLLPAKTYETRQNETQAERTTEPNPVIAPPPIFSSSGDPNFVVKVVQNVGPAVVRIDSSRW